MLQLIERREREPPVRKLNMYTCTIYAGNVGFGFLGRKLVFKIRGPDKRSQVGKKGLKRRWWIS